MYENKENFILLDHAGNIERHGFIATEHAASLDGKPRRDKLPEVKICEVCYCNFQGPQCPECGEAKLVTIRKPPEQVEGVLREIKQQSAFGDRAVESQIKRWIKKAVDREYNPYWVRHQITKKYAVTDWSKLFSAAWDIMPDGLKARRFITKNSPAKPTAHSSLEK